MALLDNGAKVNTIMPRYVKECSLPMGPITDLMDAKVACVGLGNAYTRPLGYVIIQVQVDRVQGYDEDQIALIILDFSNFAVRVPVILGTPTIGRVVNIMKEAEMDALAMPWANARAAHLLAVRRMAPIKVESDCDGGVYYQTRWLYDVYSECRNIGTFLIPCDTHKDDRDTHGQTYKHDGTGAARLGWHLAAWPNCTEHIY